ncbi:MAG TPA: biotin/lipoyl-containing protein, partial [Solirubrobacteraceae bacterium]|nr:biotin/lipoyl-containing protein [Solirubrobacteraceae bacterium]
LLGWRLDGPAPLHWRLQAETGGEVVEVAVAGDPADARVRVGGGEELRAAAHLDEVTGALVVTLAGERRAWAHARDGQFTRVGLDGRAWAFREETIVLRGDLGGTGASLEAPMPGNVLAVNVARGDHVAGGDVLLVLESMKMQLQVVAPTDGVVSEVAVAEGDRVTLGQVLVAVGSQEAA